MVYVPTDWKSGLAGGTLVTAERLNNLERQAIEATNTVGMIWRHWTGTSWPALNLPSGFLGRVTWDSVGDVNAPTPPEAQPGHVWWRART